MKLRTLTTLPLVIAAVAVPVACADDVDSYIGHPGGPGAAGLVGVPAGSYIRHPGGPGAGGPVFVPTAVRLANSGFQWGDAGVGAGFASGIALLATGTWLACRRRRELAGHRS